MLLTQTLNWYLILFGYFPHLAKFSKNRVLVVAELCNERWLQIHYTHLTGLRRAVLHFSLYQCWYWHVSTSEYSLRQVRIHVISEEIHSINPLRPQGGRRSEEEEQEVLLPRIVTMTSMRMIRSIIRRPFFRIRRRRRKWGLLTRQVFQWIVRPPISYQLLNKTKVLNATSL